MNRVQEVQKLYPNFLNIALRTADPSHKNKYLKWIASQLDKKYKEEDIKATVTAFHREYKRLRNSDIYQYENLKELEDEIKNLELSKRQAEVFTKEMGALKVYSDDICILIRINSKQAMLYYGKSSRWCISMVTEEYWEEYSSSGNIFYVLIDKETKTKYAIQKNGIVDVTIWSENDDELDINDWIKNNKKFESAIFACLHDREEPMIHKIKTRKVTRDEVEKWIKFQHECTIRYLKNNINISGYYLFDITDPTSKDLLRQLSQLSLKDLRSFQVEYPECINGIVEFLSKNPKIKVQSLRNKLGNIIPNPELILKEEEADLIKMTRDSSIASKLLKSSHQKIWSKALVIANPDDIISAIPYVNVNKQNSFIQQLKKRTHYNKLIKWLSQPNMPKIPNEIWLTKLQSERNIVNDYADGDCEEGKCIDFLANYEEE